MYFSCYSFWFLVLYFLLIFFVLEFYKMFLLIILILRYKLDIRKFVEVFDVRFYKDRVYVYFVDDNIRRSGDLNLKYIDEISVYTTLLI